MAKDWAEECTERWNRCGQTPSEMADMLGAIREALEKAEDIARDEYRRWSVLRSLEATNNAREALFIANLIASLGAK